MTGAAPRYYMFLIYVRTYSRVCLFEKKVPVLHVYIRVYVSVYNMASHLTHTHTPLYVRVNIYSGFSRGPETYWKGAYWQPEEPSPYTNPGENSVCSGRVAAPGNSKRYCSKSTVHATVKRCTSPLWVCWSAPGGCMCKVPGPNSWSCCWGLLEPAHHGLLLSWTLQRQGQGGRRK